MPKKVSDLQKTEILNSFKSGMNLKDISAIYNFSLPTIIRQLKNIIGVKKFNEIKNKNLNSSKNEKKYNPIINKSDITYEESNKTHESDMTCASDQLEERFFEIVPIEEVIELSVQKELASEPLKDANLPDVVYMLIDKNIELIPKMLKEYPEWSFMPKEDLKRYTLEIFDDHKFAKKLCTKNQKLIKVPNSKVFFLASNFLKSKGITRIIFNNLLLAF